MSLNPSNFPSIASSVEITNLPENQNVTLINENIDVNVLNQPTSIQVSNFPSGFNVNNTPTVHVDNQPTSIQVSNLVTTYDNQANSNFSALNTLLNSRGHAQLFSGLTGVNGVSFAVDVSSKLIHNLSFYGHSNGATTLTLQFSNDNITFYDTQYSYTISQASDFGFCLNASPFVFRIKSSADVSVVAFVNYS